MRQFVALLAFAGCGGGAVGPLSLEIGTSDFDGSGFHTFSAEAPLVPGAQGGFHVWVKYRVHGMDATQVHVVRSARRVSDGRDVLDAPPLSQQLGEAGYWESPSAMPSFMCPTPVGLQVRDEEIELRLELYDAEHRLEASARVTPRCALQDDFCLRICSG